MKWPLRGGAEPILNAMPAEIILIRGRLITAARIAMRWQRHIYMGYRSSSHDADELDMPAK